MAYGAQHGPNPEATFPCARCYSPVRIGAAACPNCGAPRGAASPQGTYEPQAISAPSEASVFAPPNAPHPQGAYAQSVRAKKRKKAKRELAAGIALLVVGVSLNLGTMAAEGRTYPVLYGPILFFGIGSLLKGLAGRRAT